MDYELDMVDIEGPNEKQRGDEMRCMVSVRECFKTFKRC